MSNKIALTLGMALALVLSGTAFGESTEKLEKAHEKAQTNLETMDTKDAEKLEKAHDKAQTNLETMDTKDAEKLDKAHEKADASLEKAESE